MTTALQQPERSPTPQHAADLLTDDMRRGEIRTEVSPVVAWGMIVSFLAIIFGIPVHQAIVEWRDGQRPAVLSLFSTGRFPTRGELKQYEDSLEDQSQAVRFCQPRFQEIVTSWGGFGSTSVVLGRDGWLFYRPGIDSVTGPGFLDSATLLRRSRNWRNVEQAEPLHPDPRPAILQFKRQVEAAGARLILLPIPDKSALEGAQLSSRAGAAAPAYNRSWLRFIEEMRAARVEVFDPSTTVVDPGAVRYLAHDTHWTPAWMDQVALALANHLRPQLDSLPSRPLQTQERSVSALGDLAEMLRLTDDQRLFPPQSVTIARVLDQAGQRLRPETRSQILLLGDSFANIYSAPQMGWGDSAGLPEHLSYHLQQPIDWIVRNDAGAHATRQILASQPQQGNNRLAGKKLVIWEFAARELALGDWMLLPEPER